MKKNIPWTQQELTELRKLKAEKIPHKEIAIRLKRSRTAVDRQVDRLDDQTPLDSREKYWKDRCTDAETKLAKGKETETATDILVEQIKDIAPKAYSTIFPCRVVTKRGKSSPQSAVLMFSDTHVGAKVRAEQTLGFGEYSFDTFLRRLKRLEDSVGSILRDHTTTTISEMVIPMMGDMIDGALQHAAECGQVNTLFSQFYGAGHAISQFFLNLSEMVPLVKVHTCVGNHPRWGTQKKMPTKNRFSNLDQFLYAYVEALLHDNPRIQFNLTQQPFAEFDVQGWKFLAAHGDHLRGGDKALGVPSHAIGRNVSITSQLRLHYKRPGINYYLLGHMHRPMELPHTGGDILVNGGFPGLDEYGTSENFAACAPMQKFFFVHPKHGRAACYSLNLQHADKTGPAPYDIPNTFPIV
jgi:hypothetical protein